MPSLRQMIQASSPVLAPLVLNPLMAKLAEQAGHKALYLGGGATGYAKVVLEANLNVTEMAQAGMEIRAVTDLPLILDGAAGFGDPMHMHRTIAMTEAAGFSAIEIEDQILPKRAHHHVGIEHMVPQELMEAKVREAVSARRSADFLIIARTNGIRASNMDDALKRAAAYRKAGADLLLLSPRNQEEVLHVAERLGGPLMMLARPGGLARLDMTAAELGRLGYKIIADPQTALLAGYAAWRAVYTSLANGFRDESQDAQGWSQIEHDMHATIEIDKLLEIEKATVEKG
jgi:2-methylisocitrate lyase-like PEP mutase family enzyme